MAQDQHNIKQDEKFKRMFATNKVLKEREESAPVPIWQNSTPTPEDVEAFERLGYGKDGWEILVEYLKVLKDAQWTAIARRILVALFYILLAPLGIQIIVGLTAPRVTLSYFHSSLIAAGIIVVILLNLWWSHKSKNSNKKDE